MKSGVATRKKALASKQAVIYIIDTSPSMKHLYPPSVSASVPVSASNQHTEEEEEEETDTNKKQTRLDAAKEAMIGLITDLMLQSKTNECGVIVLHTPLTKHHIIDIDCKNKGPDDLQEEEEELEDEGGRDPKFSHLTELSPVQRPSVDLLRQIQSLSFSHTNNNDNDDNNETDNPAATVAIPNRAGGFCDGIMLAFSALRRKTFGKRFNRKIILFTDAEREVDIHWDQLDDTVEGLREMECDLTVIGLDFQKSAEYHPPAVLSTDTNTNVCTGTEDDDRNVEMENEDGNHPTKNQQPQHQHQQDADMETATEEQLHAARIKDDNEMFLISLTKYTGGTVHAASTIQQILKQATGRRIPKSTLSKIELQIAPSITVEARISLSTTKQSFPSLKREAVTLNDEGEMEKNILGEIMSAPVLNITSHWDIDDLDVEVELVQRAQGYPYGSDLIPIGPMEMEGLKLRSVPCVTILGYAALECIPMTTWMGPTRIVSGSGDSRQACLAVSALAQALQRLNQVAICRFVKQKDSDPDMGILAPLVEEHPIGIGIGIGIGTSVGDEKAKVRHLLYVRMPFADDIQNLTMLPLSDAVHPDDKATKVCDDLIDAFMLPDTALNPAYIPNPAIRSFRKTMIRRALESQFDGIEEGRNTNSVDEIDPMTTPAEVLEAGKEVTKAFRDIFSLEVVEKATNGKKKKFFFSDSQEDI